MAKITTPNKIPVMRRIMLVKPVAANDNLNIIVEIIKPVFLISCEYLSVYLNEINNSSTSTRIRIVKKSTGMKPILLPKEKRNRKRNFWLKKY